MKKKMKIYLFYQDEYKGNKIHKTMKHYRHVHKHFTKQYKK